MSSSSSRRERTIIVETGELGPVRVRRLSLGGMARIAERLRAQGVHDEAALGEALVAEVVVASLDHDDAVEARSPDPFDAARLALLSEDDRRSIAAAVLTLEGVKAAGEGVVEDPRRTLARRYGHVLDTKQAARPGEGIAQGVERLATPARDAAGGAAGGTAGNAAGSADGTAAQDSAAPQIALFDELLPAPGTPSPTHPAGGGEVVRPSGGTTRTGAAWERERARLQADIGDLEALLAQQAQQREALESSAAASVNRERDAMRSARRFRFAAAGLLAALVVAVGAQFAWIGVLRREAAQERARLTNELQAQRQALEQARRGLADAEARVQQLEARRSATRPPAAGPASPSGKPASRSSKSSTPSKTAAGGSTPSGRKP